MYDKLKLINSEFLRASVMIDGSYNWKSGAFSAIAIE